MTADDTSPQTSVFEPTDTVSATPKPDQSDVIEAAAKVIANSGALSHVEAGWIAKDLHTAHLLADPADRDEPYDQLDNQRNLWAKQCHEAEARAERAEAEAAELRQKLAACELLLTDLGKTVTRVHGERAELRATVDRVRALHRECPGSVSALYPNPLCSCGVDYPCPTIRALDGAEGGAGRG